MLEILQLEFRYPEACIKTDFRLARGNCAALMGPSGSGKTTVLNLIAGFLQPKHGDIRFDGQSLLGLSPSRRPLTFLFQAHNLFPHLTVWQNLAIGINPALKLTAEQKQNILLALKWVSLSGFNNRYPSDLSGGQQQRVALARCLLRNRPLLLLDEPFSGLDHALREDMKTLISKLQRERNLAVILATHQLQDAEALDATVIELQ